MPTLKDVSSPQGQINSMVPRREHYPNSQPVRYNLCDILKYRIPGTTARVVLRKAHAGKGGRNGSVLVWVWSTMSSRSRWVVFDRYSGYVR
jgi:hypothetical protein